MRKKTKLVQGVGVNDADYAVTSIVSGKMSICPFYRAWAHMLERCYSAKKQAKYPACIGCSVAPEWHRFMGFRAWMVKQDWQGMQLDKDLLFPGSKVYGPDTCVFITSGLNKFTTDRAADRGEFPLGACWHKQSGRFRAQCCNLFTGKRESLGLFTCPDAAHEAWRKRKHEHALALAAQQSDPRIAKALSIRYLPENIHKIA